MTNNWIDEVVNGKPKSAEMWQLAYIESKLHYTAISFSEQNSILSVLNSLSEIEAEEIIKKIKENEIKTDPKDQWKEMFKSGMFNDKPV